MAQKYYVKMAVFSLFRLGSFEVKKPFVSLILSIDVTYLKRHFMNFDDKKESMCLHVITFCCCQCYEHAIIGFFSSICPSRSSYLVMVSGVFGRICIISCSSSSGEFITVVPILQ